MNMPSQQEIECLASRRKLPYVTVLPGDKPTKVSLLWISSPEVLVVVVWSYSLTDNRFLFGLSRIREKNEPIRYRKGRHNVV